MSVSAVSSSASYQSFDRLVPDLPSENAVTAYAQVGRTAEPVSDPTAPKKQLGMFQDSDGPGFADFLDLINPLQHIPIVNSIYRELSGDDIGVGARLAGGALFGGPIGLALAAVNSLVEVSTGNDIGGHMIAMFKDDTAETPTAVAAADAGQAEPKLADGRSDQAQSGDAKAVVMPDLLGAAEPPPPAAAAVATQPPTPITVEPAAAAATPAATPAVAATSAAATQAATGAPLRMMPIPGRTANASGASPRQVAAVTVPVSNNSARSNVPVTGVRTSAAGSVNPVLVQQMVASQAQHGRNGSMSVPGGAAAAAGGPPQDWFQGAMLHALDKYDRSAKLGQQTAVTPPIAVP